MSLGGHRSLVFSNVAVISCASISTREEASEPFQDLAIDQVVTGEFEQQSIMPDRIVRFRKVYGNEVAGFVVI